MNLNFWWKVSLFSRFCCVPFADWLPGWLCGLRIEDGSRIKLESILIFLYAIHRPLPSMMTVSCIVFLSLVCQPASEQHIRHLLAMNTDKEGCSFVILHPSRQMQVKMISLNLIRLVTLRVINIICIRVIHCYPCCIRYVCGCVRLQRFLKMLCATKVD